ncbi:hypothetical protein ACHAPT_011278 [Fusarium lateritium]
MGMRENLLVTLHVGNTKYPLGCRDNVDKINAVKGMAIDAGFLSEIRRPNAEWKEYFIALTDRLIRQGHVDLLSICRHRDSSLPSDYEQLFDAGAGTTFRYYPSDSPRILNLHGYHIDEIIEVSDPLPHDSVDVCGPEWDENPKTGAKPHETIHSLQPDLFHFGRAKIRFVQLGTVMTASPLYTEEQAKGAIWRIPVVDKEMNENWQVTRATDKTRQEMDNLSNSIQKVYVYGIMDGELRTRLGDEEHKAEVVSLE